MLKFVANGERRVATDQMIFGLAKFAIDVIYKIRLPHKEVVHYGNA